MACYIFANSFSYVSAYLSSYVIVHINSTFITEYKLLCYLSAYNVHMESAHWEMMLRAR